MSEAGPIPGEAGLAAGYNTHAVERLTGVPATTFRAWERRYGVPSPRRLPGGQRVYEDRDVAVVRWLREQTERGLSARLAVAQLRQSPETAEQRPLRATYPLSELTDGIVRAGFAFDSTAMERTLSQALAVYPLETVAVEVIQPALVELGEQWHQGNISPAVEHFTTAVVRRRLEQLASLVDAGAGRPLLVAGTAPGELHETGVLMLSIFLRRRGLRVIYLGPNVTTEAVLEVARRARPDLVCLSASTTPTALALRSVAAALATLDPPRPRFAFGGQAFPADPALIDQIQGIYFPGDAPEAAASAEALLRK